MAHDDIKAFEDDLSISKGEQLNKDETILRKEDIKRYATRKGITFNEAFRELANGREK